MSTTEEEALHRESYGNKEKYRQCPHKDADQGSRVEKTCLVCVTFSNHMTHYLKYILYFLMRNIVSTLVPNEKRGLTLTQNFRGYNYKTRLKKALEVEFPVPVTE